MAENAAGVAAGHALTAEAASEALKDGGTAVDAAIAGLWTATVSEPVLSSPGGGGFMMIGHRGQTNCLDFFVETPPQRPAGDIDAFVIEADFGPTTQAFTIGNGTSAVPGFVHGLFAAHERYGRLPMNTLVAHAASVARDGFTINAFQAFLFSVVAPILIATPSARALFADRDGKTIRPAGSVFRNPNLADALEEIASEGIEAVRHGEIAGLILRAQADGGTLTADALAAYQPHWRTPKQAIIAGARVFLNPPPSAGGTLIARMIDGHDKTADLPAMASTMAATDRAWSDSGRSLQSFLNLQGPGHKIAQRGTTHISVIDADGMAVAATVSNGEGNGTIVPQCGFMVNNMLGEDDVNPDGVADWQPGIRLSSMMAPTLASDADGGLAVLGSGGSNRIRSAVYCVLVRHLAGRLPLEDAITAARLHIENGFLEFEGHIDDDDRTALEAQFPERRCWDEPNLFFGGVHAVRKNADGGIGGAGDPRRGGVFVTV